MYFNAGQTLGAEGAVLPQKNSAGAQPNRNLSPKQFGPKAGPAEAEGAGAAEGAAGAEGAAAAGAGEAAAGGGLADLAALALL